MKEDLKLKSDYYLLALHLAFLSSHNSNTYAFDNAVEKGEIAENSMLSIFIFSQSAAIQMLLKMLWEKVKILMLKTVKCCHYFFFIQNATPPMTQNRLVPRIVPNGLQKTAER